MLTRDDDRSFTDAGRGPILFDKITEAEIKARQLVIEGSQLRQMINRLVDFGGGVHKTREPQSMDAEFQKTKNAPTE